MIRSIYNYDVMWKHLQFLLAVKSQVLLILLGSVSYIKNGNTLFHLVIRKNTNSVPFSHPGSQKRPLTSKEFSSKIATTAFGSRGRQQQGVPSACWE